MKIEKIALLALLLTVLGVWAYNPPVDRQADVAAGIVQVPAEVSVSDGVVFRVQVSNERADAVSFRLRVYMNDDWRVEPQAAAGWQTLAAGAQFEQAFTGRALPRVLTALYPVHAEVELRFDDGGMALLHPIAIFSAVRPAAASESVSAQPAGGVISAQRLQTPVLVDGGLSDWSEQAQPVAFGYQHISVGTISPETLQSFNGTLMFLHDEENLYVAGVVKDDDISCDDKTSDDFMNSDYLRIYASAATGRADHEGLGERDRVVAINLFGGDGGEPLLKAPGYFQDAVPGGIKVATRRLPDGYSFEVQLPFAGIGEGIAAAKRLGFNLMLGDADHGRRRNEYTLGGTGSQYWLKPSSYVTLELGDVRSAASAEVELLALPLSKGVWKLGELPNRRCSYIMDGKTEVVLAHDFSGGDRQSGVSFQAVTATRGGAALPAISVHPPYRGGTGEAVVSYRLQLPAGEPAVFQAQTAIRDHDPKTEPASDGVEFVVAVATADDAAPARLFSRFSDSKVWEPVAVDLSAYAGKEIVLSLLAGPGPARNTTCDSAFWGVPTVVVGVQPQPLSEEAWREREEQAIALARQAAVGKRGAGAFTLRGEAGQYGAAIIPGDEGMVDGVIAFSDGAKDLCYRGFALRIHGEDIGIAAGSAPVRRVKARRGWLGDFIVDHQVDIRGDVVPFRLRARADGGVLKLEWSMPGQDRDQRGQPRFEKIAVGPGREAAWRVYAGFGNVIEDLQAPFTLSAGGFSLSTRHVGADYRSGLSMALASDYFPDRLRVVPADKLFTLEAHHDLTYFMAPSSGGAFSAAKEYGKVAGFKASPGLEELKGRQCLDQWGGDYLAAAEQIRMAARYGLDHSVFVKHVWQRWGYDYRLPEIYPPAGGLDAFKALADACHDTGILFSPHDNYIDFYPDAKGFSYDHIIFNADGTPQKAWYNKGRKAQSYRWLPHAFQPWMVENMQLMRDGFAPNSLFIDVFTAITPRDYYDREGRFYDQKRMAKEWAEAFDTCRRILKKGSPMLSECGHDGLIGSLDGAQSDHYHARRWGAQCLDTDRTPWHDIVTHGKMVLLAGGLGGRYGKGEPGHDYGSDDYLSNTVLGGRNPMSDGPFSRAAVLTYWLLHDVCDVLARQSFDRHEFGGTVRQQHTVFGGGASRVWANRGAEDWTLADGRVLPEYGFWVETPEASAGTFAIDGKRVRMAQSPNMLFVDTLPPAGALSGRTSIATRVEKVEKLSEQQYLLQVSWDFQYAFASTDINHFIHVCHPDSTHPESILFHGAVKASDLKLSEPGKYTSDIVVDIPGDVPAGELNIRYGLYSSKYGNRLSLSAADVTSGRVNGGVIKVERQGGAVRSEYISKLDEIAISTTDLPMIDFGMLSTNGSFRLQTPNPQTVVVIPMAGSLPFRAELDLAKLGYGGKTARSANLVMPWLEFARQPVMSQQGDRVTIELDAQAFAYEIHF